MRCKIKILLLIIAYVLNFAHEFQTHEHLANSLPDSIPSKISLQVETQKTTHHRHNTESDEYEKGQDENSLPFSHSHSFHSHGLVLVRVIQSSIVISDISGTCETIFCFSPPKLQKKDFFLTDEKNFYQTCIGSSLSPRAPPFYS